ncbi:hypothetical protein GGX14DRAFT_560702 [Mycena pura]|uniref:Uncharacterized protein n=1 Tax=Mycena pura TaxID=153505 RepID=A0AAD6VNH9_9AGAR|nr:hypothetical protein GGX14DRAFT_560702 [Mycena pura]
MASETAPATALSLLPYLPGLVGSRWTTCTCRKSADTFRQTYTVRDTRDVSLYIEDLRGHVVEHSVERVQLVAVPSSSPTSEYFQVAAADVLTALQASLSSLVGPAKIGVPDHDDAMYTSYFAVIIGTESPNPETLHGRLLRVSSAGKLCLKISHFQAINSADTIINRSLLAAPPVIMQSSPPPPSSVPEPKHAQRVPIPLSDEQTRWLREKMEGMTGYHDFAQSHHKQLTNLQRARYWKFAGDFSHRYHKQPWPANISSGRIRRPALEQVLRMSKTSLHEAMNMTRILDRFYFGDHRAEDVVRVIEDQEQVGAAETLRSSARYKSAAGQLSPPTARDLPHDTAVPPPIATCRRRRPTRATGHPQIVYAMGFIKRLVVSPLGNPPSQMHFKMLHKLPNDHTAGMCELFATGVEETEDPGTVVEKVGPRIGSVGRKKRRVTSARCVVRWATSARAVLTVDAAPFTARHAFLELAVHVGSRWAGVRA